MIWMLLMMQVDGSAVEQRLRSQPDPTGPRLGMEVGPYRPRIDAELEGKTPFADVFGDNTPWLIRFRGGYAWSQPFGRIAVSVSAGWARKSVNALAEDGGRSGGKTSIRLYPVDALLQLHWDQLAELIHVPLSPYVGGGFTYTFWQITKGDGTTAVVNGNRARGGTPGFEVVGGLALLLHRIDEKAARMAKETFGIEGADLYGQFVYVGSIGKERLDVGAITWQMGLSVAF